MLDRHDLHPSKALGQHFVADPNTSRRIVRLAEVDAAAHVVEIGAGLGSLTLALGATGARVVAVEIDRRLVPVLREVTAGMPSVRVVEADALAVDWQELLSGADAWSLVANLPYNVATPLVMRMLVHAPSVCSQLVMVQREVAERLAAVAGAEAYGAVSVKVAYWATAEVVGVVPRSVFVPRPNVDSALVRVERRPTPAVPVDLVSYERLCTVVNAGFRHRRKMLRRALAGVVPPAAFESTGIAPTSRAEELDVFDWGRLAGWSGQHLAAHRGPATK